MDGQAAFVLGVLMLPDAMAPMIDVELTVSGDAMRRVVEASR